MQPAQGKAQIEFHQRFAAWMCIKKTGNPMIRPIATTIIPHLMLWLEFALLRERKIKKPVLRDIKDIKTARIVIPDLSIVLYRSWKINSWKFRDCVIHTAKTTTVVDRLSRKTRTLNQKFRFIDYPRYLNFVLCSFCDPFESKWKFSTVNLSDKVSSPTDRDRS